ncbi:MAG: GumC family protein [Trichodesmium sp.]
MDIDPNSHLFSPQSNDKYVKSLSQLNTYQNDESEEQQLDLAWVFGVFRRRLLIMIGIAILLNAGIGSLIITKARQIIPVYSGSFRLLVEPISAEAQFARQYLRAKTSNIDPQKIRADQAWGVDYETLVKVLRSPQLMNSIVEKIQTVYPDMTYNSLANSILIARENVEKNGKQQGTKIVSVQYKNTDPEKIRFILEQVSEEYLSYSSRERISSIQQGINFIEEQLPILEARVDVIQMQIKNLRQDYNIIDPTLEAKSLSDQLLNLKSQRLKSKAELAKSKALYAAVEKQLEANNPLSILTKYSKGYDVLIDALNRVTADIASKSSKYQEDSLIIQTLREQQENLLAEVNEIARKVVLEQIQLQIEELEGYEQNMAETESILNERISKFPIIAQEYADLERKLDVANKALKEFLAKGEALKIDAAQQLVPWQLIAPPQVVSDSNGNPVATTSSQAKKQLAVVFVLSCLAALGAGFLIEVLSKVFHSPEDVKAASKLPIIGLIPFDKALKKVNQQKKLPALAIGKGGFVSQSNNHKLEYNASPLSEAFRSLYTNIRLLGGQKSFQSLTISSATSGDGKSTVAIHLAQTAATIGQRVLLVDADLRHPKIHHKLDLLNLQGLSDAINREVSLNDAIQRSPWDDNLFVLTAGEMTQDPIKLLSAKKTQYLMEQFQAFFDLVIYDTPPIADLADASLIAHHTDQTILVVSVEQTDRSILIKALEGFKISGGSILGIVVNRIKH